MAPIVAFFALTYLASWSAFAAATSLAENATPGALAASTAIRLLGVFAPSLVALAVTAGTQGAAGVRLLLDGLTRAPGQLRLWVFAGFFMATVKLAGAVIHLLFFGAWPAFGAQNALGLLGMFAAVLISTPFQAGEEVGWRGFALPRLAERLGLPAASITLGALWAGWHIPLFFDPAGDTYHQSFPVYLVGVIALSVILAWLWWRGRGSLLLVMFAHAAINNTKDIVPSAGPAGESPWTFAASPMAWFSASLLWIVAGALILRMRWSHSSAPTSGPSPQDLGATSNASPGDRP
jgi:uncharacterized protein